MDIGYARCSTEEQNEARQIEYFESVGVEKIFLDKMTGSTAERPQLKAMLEYAREGDTVYISEISRLARSVRDLLDIVETLTQKGVRLISKKESVDTESDTGRFMLTVFGAMAELERNTIKARQAEGIAVAKRENKYKGRKPIAVDEVVFRAECAKWRAGKQTATETLSKLGLKRNTFYNLVKKYEV